jgi:hypothetical protein
MPLEKKRQLAEGTGEIVAQSHTKKTLDSQKSLLLVQKIPSMGQRRLIF